MCNEKITIAIKGAHVQIAEGVVTMMCVMYDMYGDQ